MTMPSSDDASAATTPAPGLMTTDSLVKVCAFVSVTYLALVLYFLGSIHGWDLFDLPFKSTRTFHGSVAGLFGTLPCALTFLALAWLMRQWNHRRAAADTSRWNRFPVPFHQEIPATDPVGRAYRAVFFALVFGVGAYAQADLFRSFLQGRVYLSPPRVAAHATAEPARAPQAPTPHADEAASSPATMPAGDETCHSFHPAEEDRVSPNPLVREYALSQCGWVINTWREHFAHRFTSFFTNEYHFAQTSGLSYAPGYQPYTYLLATVAMAVAWLLCIAPWLSPRSFKWRWKSRSAAAPADKANESSAAIPQTPETAPHSDLSNRRSGDPAK